METDRLGRLVARRREQKKISLQALTAGICSIATLQRLETGGRIPDFFVLERMLERLGISANKLEFLHDEAAYDIYYLRELVEAALSQKDYGEAAEALAYYESQTAGQEALHWQYICKMRAVIAGEAEGDWEKAALLLWEAIEQTVSGFALHRLEQYALGESELVLILMWLQAKAEMGEIAEKAGSSRILSYAGRVCADREMYANVYSKAAWVLGNLALRRQDRPAALYYAGQGEEILAENGWLLHLPQLLERLAELTEGDERREWEKQRDALRQLYEEYGQSWETGQIELWKNYRQQEIYLVSEQFAQERRVRQKSQEQLAEELDINPKTVSRLELGKYKPKPGTFQKMKEYLGLDRDIVSTRLVVDDWELLEMERQIAGLGQQRNIERKDALYRDLRKRLSLDYNENRQYVLFQDVLFAKRKGQISAQEAIDRCREAFEVTKGHVSLEQIDQIVLSRMEATIVNYIALRYDELGKREDAITLLEKVKSGYENSKVDTKYHYVGLSLVYEHLSVDYEKCGYFLESIAACDTAIRFELRCMKGRSLGFLVDQKAFTRGNMIKDQVQGKESYRQAYQLHKLMRMERSMINLQKAYEKLYQESID